MFSKETNRKEIGSANQIFFNYSKWKSNSTVCQAQTTPKQMENCLKTSLSKTISETTLKEININRIRKSDWLTEIVLIQNQQYEIYYIKIKFCFNWKQLKKLCFSFLFESNQIWWFHFLCSSHFSPSLSPNFYYFIVFLHNSSPFKEYILFVVANLWNRRRSFTQSNFIFVCRLYFWHFNWINFLYNGIIKDYKWYRISFSL